MLNLVFAFCFKLTTDADADREIGEKWMLLIFAIASS